MSSSAAPSANSSPWSTPAAGEWVLLLPWHLLGDYSHNLYAKVDRVEATHIFVRTRAVTGENAYPASALRVELGRFPPRRVTRVEVNGYRTGKYMYKAVMFEHEGFYLHGQVIEYTNKPTSLVVRTKDGPVTTSPDAILLMPPPLCFLFFNSTCSTLNWDRDRIRGAHKSVWDRLLGFDISEPLENILDHAFSGFSGSDTCKAPTHRTDEWVNIVTGQTELCHPAHAALFTRFNMDWDSVSVQQANMVGPQWCADPSNDIGIPDNVDATNDAATMGAASPLPSSTGSQLPYEEKSKPPNMKLPKSNNKDASKTPTKEDVNPSEEDPVEDDWNEASSQASGTASKASDVVSKHLNNNARPAPTGQTLRDKLGLTDASFNDMGRRAKKLHYPTSLQNIMSRAFHNDTTNRMDAQSLIESFNGAGFPWLVHPYMSIRLRNAQFGLSGVRGFMFRRVEERERRTWALKNAEYLQDYGENCKIFDLPALATKQELVEAYGNLIYYWSYYGSELAVTFGTQLQRFLSSLQLSDMPTPITVGAYMEFIDSVLANFSRAVQCDARNNTATHERVHHQLVKSNPDLVKELNYLMNDRLQLLEANLSKRKSSEPNAASSSKKSKKNSKTTVDRNLKPHDSSVLHLVGKHEGKQVCLRYLSAAGCFSKDPKKCSSDQRIHHVPSEPLPPEVVKHMKEKWGGVAPNLKHLTG